MIILWFSCGAASAVACKLALEKYPDARIVYQHIESAHPDNYRFARDCEKWYGRKIQVIRSRFYRDQFDVCSAVKYINGPAGAPCTVHLKKNVRKIFEKENPGITVQVFGMTAEEQDRQERLNAENDGFKFPLIEKGIYKKECYERLLIAGIELPEMYRLGFNNNNCVGCVKGGKGYWNRIRRYFPDHFERMAKIEREIGHSCINGKFLDELKPGEGRHKEPDISCGLFCAVAHEQEAMRL